MYNSKIREICYAYALANKMALPLSVEDTFNAVALWVEDTVTGMVPYVGANNHWYVYDKETQVYKDSGVQATGDKGDTGATPNIQITATVSQNTGTPSVNVEKSGTPENPLFKLVFDRIKGEAGRDVLMLPVLGSVITEGTELAFANTNFNRTPNVGDTGYVISVRDLTIYIAEFTIIPNGETISDDFSTVKYGRVKSITLSDVNYKGLWANNSDYYVNDIVTYEGSSYICIENISNSISNDTPNFDTTHWAIFASGGDSQHFARANVMGDLKIREEIPIVNVTPANPMIGDGIIALGNRRPVNTTPAGTWLILGKVTKLGGTSTSATMEVITYIELKGAGIPAGGTTGQYLIKKSDTDYDTEWSNPAPLYRHTIRVQINNPLSPGSNRVIAYFSFLSHDAAQITSDSELKNALGLEPNSGATAVIAANGRIDTYVNGATPHFALAGILFKLKVMVSTGNTYEFTYVDLEQSGDSEQTIYFAPGTSNVSYNISDTVDTVQ